MNYLMFSGIFTFSIEWMLRFSSSGFIIFHSLLSFFYNFRRYIFMPLSRHAQFAIECSLLADGNSQVYFFTSCIYFFSIAFNRCFLFHRHHVSAFDWQQSILPISLSAPCKFSSFHNHRIVFSDGSGYDSFILILQSLASIHRIDFLGNFPFT